MIFLILIYVLPFYNLLITIYNLFTSGELKEEKCNNPESLVSILIPVRNEEDNIGELINCLEIQSFNNIEIIILDDFSTDNTFSVCRELSGKDQRIQLVRGTELPEGWLGKNWACYQLSEAANGDYLLFIDADVRPGVKAVESALSKLENSNSDLLTVYPFQTMISTGEKICVGALNWIFYSFLPIAKIYNSRSKNIAGAVGQFMFWKKEVYVSSGGHHSVKDKIVEDIELGKSLKKKGYRINLLRGGKLISCRMYSSFRSAANGFTKNAYPSANNSALIYFLFLVFLSVSYLLPLILFYKGTFFFILLIIVILQRIIFSFMSKGNIFFEIIIYPVQIIVMIYISVRSYVFFRKNKLQWKGRTL